jgi:hypothetical protein
MKNQVNDDARAWDALSKAVRSEIGETEKPLRELRESEG